MVALTAAGVRVIFVAVALALSVSVWPVAPAVSD